MLIGEILTGGLKRMREKRRADARDAEAARAPANGNGGGNGNNGDGKADSNGKADAKSPPGEKTPPVVASIFPPEKPTIVPETAKRSASAMRARFRDLGFSIGRVPTGPAGNAITDVPGVRVGHTTLIEGEGPLVVGEGPVRTGSPPSCRPIQFSPIACWPAPSCSTARAKCRA
jgi:hypothetical protein